MATVAHINSITHSIQCFSPSNSMLIMPNFHISTSLQFKKSFSSNILSVSNSIKQPNKQFQVPEAPPLVFDQTRALNTIDSDPDLSCLSLVQAPLVDIEIRGVPALQFWTKFVIELLVGVETIEHTIDVIYLNQDTTML
ncbi:hypothetical protein Leryth_019235 [Lithospermum erythrorhizon]|nr:hypothetical protein Leryth_019235 [Lithospermum erythrorhizon]